MSLMELMVALAIIGLLTAMAFPVYTRHVARTHRVAAQACMAEYAHYMERFYVAQLRYDRTIDGAANDDPHLGCQSRVTRNYAITVSVAPASFLVTATPAPTQARHDASCGTLSVNQRGMRSVSGSSGVTACW